MQMQARGNVLWCAGTEVNTTVVMCVCATGRLRGVPRLGSKSEEIRSDSRGPSEPGPAGWQPGPVGSKCFGPMIDCRLRFLIVDLVNTHAPLLERESRASRSEGEPFELAFIPLLVPYLL